MNLGRLSINQPILAMVLSMVLLIVGAIAYQTLPVSEYPQVVPPTVTVTTQYPGASAQTVSDTVCRRHRATAFSRCAREAGSGAVRAHGPDPKRALWDKGAGFAPWA